MRKQVQLQQKSGRDRQCGKKRKLADLPGSVRQRKSSFLFLLYRFREAFEG